MYILFDEVLMYRTGIYFLAKYMHGQYNVISLMAYIDDSYPIHAPSLNDYVVRSRIVYILGPVQHLHQ